jgi:serine-type anaerobic sulfatase-maturating enzyme
MTNKSLQTLLIKPSGADCNLNCSYCFYLDKASIYPGEKTHRMSDSVLEELVKQAMRDSDKQIGMVWQGGEPTLLGLDFFKRVIDLQLQYGKNISIANILQTNGLLLNTHWADFLAEYNFLVGVSIDGPQHVHDHYRKDKAGNRTLEKVFQNTKLLLDRKVAVNSLSCVTNYSANYPEEIYGFLYRIGINNMQFIPVVETDQENQMKAADFSVSAKGYGEFLCRIFDLWKSDFSYGMPKVSVRFFEELFYNYVGYEPPECTFQKECGKYVVVEYNGDVYSCDYFVEEKGLLGNVMQADLLSLLNSKKQKEFGLQKGALNEQCNSCKWLTYCNGGCIKDRVKDSKDKGHNHFCESYKMIFEYADSFMKQLAEKWLENQKKQAKTYRF